MSTASSRSDPPSSDNITPAAPKRLKRLTDEDAKSFVTPLSQESTASSATPLTRSEIDALLWKEAAYNSSQAEIGKRADYITWDDYFMAVAELSSMRSKDPHAPTGACLADRQNRIIGIGYRGFPIGCEDDCLPWKAEDERWLHTSAPFVVHAGINAVLNRCSSNTGARLYTPSFPCNECAKMIVQSRAIDEVVYFRPKDCNSHGEDAASTKASRILLGMAGIRMRQYTPSQSSITLSLQVSEEERTTGESSSVSDAITDLVAKHRPLMLEEAQYDPSMAENLKRRNVLSWDDYFMAVASLTAHRSKDPNTQVGACIVDEDKRIVGLGYNGFPAGCDDSCMPWARSADDELHTKYPYVCHAEQNCILNKGSANVKGATLYTALFPCHECAKVICQARLSEVVYLHDRYHDTDSCRASRILLQMAGVRLRRHVPDRQSITIDLGTA